MSGEIKFRWWWVGKATRWIFISRSVCWTKVQLLNFTSVVLLSNVSSALSHKTLMVLFAMMTAKFSPMNLVVWSSNSLVSQLIVAFCIRIPLKQAEIVWGLTSSKISEMMYFYSSGLNIVEFFVFTAILLIIRWFCDDFIVGIRCTDDRVMRFQWSFRCWRWEWWTWLLRCPHGGVL